MKKATIIKVTSLFAVSVIGISAFAGCAMKQGKNNDRKQITSAYLNQSGSSVEATVDISDGYSCEFTRGAIYLYDQNTDENAQAIGLTLDKDVYDEYMTDANNDKDHKEVKDGIIFTIDDQIAYIRTVDDNAYFAIFAYGDGVDADQLEKIAERISIAPEM